MAPIGFRYIVVVLIKIEKNCICSRRIIMQHIKIVIKMIEDQISSKLQLNRSS